MRKNSKVVLSDTKKGNFMLKHVVELIMIKKLFPK